MKCLFKVLLSIPLVPVFVVLAFGAVLSACFATALTAPVWLSGCMKTPDYISDWPYAVANLAHVWRRW